MAIRCTPVLALIASVLATTPARAQEQGREPPSQDRSTDRAQAAARQARGQQAARAFLLGRYDEALAIYVDLYVESDGRVEYLRNIGRCQQKLGQHERALQAFKDYLLRAKISAAERAEVRAFIAEVEKARADEAAA